MEGSGLCKHAGMCKLLYIAGSSISAGMQVCLFHMAEGIICFGIQGVLIVSVIRWP